ncbi:MAG: Ig-like domain-containing protein [Fidelibacterota bacterium]
MIKILKTGSWVWLAASLVFITGCDIAGSGRPEIVSINPADGSSGVDRNTDIVVTFSEPMDPSSCEKRFKLVAGIVDRLPDGPGIPGEFQWDNYSQTMTFDPDSMLDAHKSYSISLESGMKAHHDGHSMNLMGMRDQGMEVTSGILSFFDTE